MKLKDQALILLQLESEIDSLVKKEKELFEIQRGLTYPATEPVMEERKSINSRLFELRKNLLNQKNVVKALENSGEVTSLTDKHNELIENIPDFRKVNTNAILFDEETILIEKEPSYIPFIDEEIFARKGYVFDAIRIEKDSYILQPTGFKDDYPNQYVLVTLDQLVLIADYYTNKARAISLKEADDKNKRAEEYWDKQTEERRKSFLDQRNLYFSLPAKEKKKITQAEYEALDWKEKEKIYKFYKRYGAKKLNSKLEDTQMWVSFHSMYQKFIDPDAWPINKDHSLAVGKRAGLGLYGNPVIFKFWYYFRDMLNFKIKDIRIQREDLSESRKQAIETSFGESNTSTDLREQFGILVKRQNGDPIKPFEIEEIKTAWESVQKTFGNLKPNALKYNIKVSHSGTKLIFASKAIGMYIPSMGTIGVSNKYGENQFKSTISHEIAHFIDNFIGKLTGKRYATDDFESTAGQIAFTFRYKMNKPWESQTDYTNATKECFARALQQFYGIENFGDEASISHSYVDLGRTIPLYNAEDFVNKSNYEETIRPLIIKFFEENTDVFESTIDIDNTNEIEPIGTEKSESEVQDDSEEIRGVIETLESLIEESNEEEKIELQMVIETLKSLI